MEPYCKITCGKLWIKYRNKRKSNEPRIHSVSFSRSVLYDAHYIRTDFNCLIISGASDLNLSGSNLYSGIHTDICTQNNYCCNNYGFIIALDDRYNGQLHNKFIQPNSNISPLKMELYVSQFVLFLLIFARVASMIIVAPIVGHQSVPVQAKVAIGLFISYVLYPLVASQQQTVSLELVAIAVVAIKEIFLGLLIGFAMGLIFAGVRFAGELIAFDMGISMANVFDPESNQSNPVVGEFLYVVMLLTFLLLNGHHFIFQSLYYLFQAVPLGGLTISAPLTDWMIKLSGIVFIIGVKMAAPVIVASFLMNVALAVLSRVVPQMNIFSVSFPLKIGVGFAVLISSGPLMIFVFKKMLTGFENDILEMMKVL